VTIIPLAPVSRPGSSDLPEGLSFRSASWPVFRPAHFTNAEGSALFQANSTSRAGSPLLFGLAPRGVFRASVITDGAVGSYPTFSPLPALRHHVDIPKVFLRSVTEPHNTGGLFSVALSVTSSIGFSL
jgi:hypothetical protein